jgi:hypothetical protein
MVLVCRPISVQSVGSYHIFIHSWKCRLLTDFLATSNRRSLACCFLFMVLDLSIAIPFVHALVLVITALTGQFLNEQLNRGNAVLK